MNQRLSRFLVVLILTFIPFSGLASDDSSELLFFSEEDLLKDLEQLHQLLIDVHPKPFKFLSEHSYNQKYKAVVEGLNNGGTAIDFFTVVAPLIAEINDDQTMLIPPSASLNILPFGITSIDDTEVIPISFIAKSTFPSAGRLMDVNGTSWGTIQQGILKRISGSNIMRRKSLFAEHPDHYLNTYMDWGGSVALSFCVPIPIDTEINHTPDFEQEQSTFNTECLYDVDTQRQGYIAQIQLPTIPKERPVLFIDALDITVVEVVSPKARAQLVMPAEGRFIVLSSRNPLIQVGDILVYFDGEPINKRSFDTLAGKETVRLSSSRYGRTLELTVSLYMRSKRKNYEFYPLNENVMMLRIERFQSQEGFKTTLEKMFATMRENNQDQLIVDIRNSHGGDEGLIKTFFSYVSDEKMTTHQAVMVKRSKEMKSETPLKYYALPIMFFWKDNKSETYRIPSIERSPFKRNHRFLGDIILLTDENTFSVATLLAAVLSDYDRALIIGQETGSSASRLGSSIPFQLRHTKIKGLVSQKYFIRPSGDTSASGVLPNRYEHSEDALDIALEVMKFKKLD